ncbi:SGNH/GDSL hydrolase family protein [Nonomuraea longicatena]|uniref:SGNH/GDSL hydrolase family protein n=1 Tax=Nonomuraea longicatena TaxID=83682 RepID=A0ABP3ZPC3_9ACTN
MRLLIATALTLLSLAPAPAHATTGRWTGTWATAMQRPFPGAYNPNWSETGFENQSVRQIVRISVGGDRVRIRLSNRYGTAPLRLTGATLARAGEGAATGEPVRVTFAGDPQAVVQAGRDLVSDPVRIRVSPRERLATTFYFHGPTGPASFHDWAMDTAYRAPGDQRFATSGAAFTESSKSWYFLTGVEVTGRARGSVAVFGDSVTDGTSSTHGADRRYPDRLAERLLADGKPLGVLNTGLSGNRVLNDSTCFGERAGDRFRRDVLDRPGVRAVVVMQGVNDVGFPTWDYHCAKPNPVVSAEQLIEGHRALIRAAKARGLTVVGGTIVPFKNSFMYSDAGEATRDAVNHWIRTSGEYDAVADFDKVLADGDVLRPEYDPGDALHPNDAGLKAMADAVDLDVLWDATK